MITIFIRRFVRVHYLIWLYIQSGGLFGATTTTTPSLGFFGSNQPQQATTGFGLATQNTATGGLFGQKPLGFSQTTTASSFTFGAPQASQSGLGGAFGGSFFNKPAVSGSTGFGMGAQNTGLAFGGFGSTSTSLGASAGFGGLGTNTAGSLFSNQQKQAGSLFGNTNTGFGLTAGLASNPLGGGLGAANTGALGGGAGFFGAGNAFAGTQQQATAESQFQQEQQKMVQHHIASMNSSPYGDSPLFKNLTKDPARQSELLKPTNPAAQQMLLSTQLRYRPVSTSRKIKTRAITSLFAEKASLFHGLENEENSSVSSLNQPEGTEGETFVPRKNYKHLDIKLITEQQKLFNNLQANNNSSAASTQQLSPSAALQSDAARRTPLTAGQNNSNDVVRSNTDNQRNRSRLNNMDPRFDNGSPLDNTMAELNPKGARPLEPLDQNDRHSNLTELPRDATSADNSARAPHPAGVVQTRPDYFTLPSLEEMEGLVDEEGRCIVKDFVVGREGYGNVFFPGDTDVANMNIDELVYFRRKEVEIYPNDETKPPLGEGMNKKAQITLDFVYPVDKATGETVTDYQRLLSMGFIDRLERQAHRMNAKFVEYRPETGSFVFIVNHFSKYGILDEDDDDLPLEKPAQTGTDAASQVNVKMHQQTKLLLADKQLTQQKKLATGQKPQFQFSEQKQSVYDNKYFGNKVQSIVEEDEDDKDETEIKKAKMSLYSRYDLQDARAAMDEDEADDGKENELMGKKKFNVYFDDDGQGSDDDDHEMSYSSFQESYKQVSAHQVQLQKASFFGASEFDDDEEGEDRKEDVLIGNKNVDFKDWALLSNKQQIIQSPFSVKTSARSLPLTESTNQMLSIPASKMPGLPSSITVTTTIVATTTVMETLKSIFPILPSKMTFEDLSRLDGGAKLSSTLTLKKKRVAVPFEKSLMFGKQAELSDLGLYQGASTRLGWGAFWGPEAAGWTFVHVGLPVCEEEGMGDLGRHGYGLLTQPTKVVSEDAFAVVRLERIIPPSSLDDGFGQRRQRIEEMLEECLGVELDHCEVVCPESDVADETSSGECPFFSYSSDSQSLLSSMASKLEELSDESEWSKAMCSVWKLCLALWGGFEGVADDLEDYYYQSLRKEAVTQWLVDDAEPRIVEQIKLTGSNNMDGHVTFARLTGCQIKQAAEEAIKIKDFHLALILAQAMGTHEVKLNLRKQLLLWADNKTDQFISESRLATFALMAGILVLRTSKDQINCCDSLDWKRCFGLHLWYACPSTCTIAEALKEYEASYQGSSPRGRYSAAPNPRYMERWCLNEEAGVKDVAFHLLKLFTNKSYPLQFILNPSAFSENDMDYSCSWHLMKLLGSLGFQAINCFHFATVCHNYASQLEALGLWHWAAFVLMHIPNPISRKDAVVKLIQRNSVLLPNGNEGRFDGECDGNVGDFYGDVVVDDDIDLSSLNDKEKFVVQKLKIPLEWIHGAKAIRASYEGLDEIAAFHLFGARRFLQYHDLVVNKLASAAVANRDHSALRSWFERLERVGAVGGRFEEGGVVYLKYLHLLEVLEKIMPGDVEHNDASEEELDELESLSSVLSNRISFLPSITPMDRYAQQLMSQAVARTHLRLASRDHGDHLVDEEYVKHLAEIQANLPMTDDSVAEAASMLTHEHLKSIIIRQFK